MLSNENSVGELSNLLLRGVFGVSVDAMTAQGSALPSGDNSHPQMRILWRKLSRAALLNVAQSEIFNARNRTASRFTIKKAFPEDVSEKACSFLIGCLTR